MRRRPLAPDSAVEWPDAVGGLRIAARLYRVAATIMQHAVPSSVSEPVRSSYLRAFGRVQTADWSSFSWRCGLCVCAFACVGGKARLTEGCSFRRKVE